VARVIERLPKGNPVFGVTLLDNRLYLLRGYKSSKQIEEYDIDSYRLLRCLTVPQLRNSEDIVACKHNRCAYVSDYARKCVHRVALPDATVTQWPVDDQPAGLALTARHGVLVTCFLVRRIKEFSTHGVLMHVLTLPEEVVSPLQTIQLPSGHFLVCQGERCDEIHRVCLLGPDGHVVRAFGGAKGSGSQQFNVPGRLAVDKNGFVFVADVDNCRVSLLSPSLAYVRQVMSREQLQELPFRLHLDSDNRRMYVAVNSFDGQKYTAGRVSVVIV